MIHIPGHQVAGCADRVQYDPVRVGPLPSLDIGLSTIHIGLQVCEGDITGKTGDPALIHSPVTGEIVRRTRIIGMFGVGYIHGGPG